ncbi:hypothetical protein D9M71_299190 [compost metagenome]
MVDRRNALGSKQLGEQTHHHLAVLEHIADAAGGAQIVLKHVVGAIPIADQVNPGDMRVDIAVQVQALHRQLVLLVGQDLLGRNDPGLDDPLVVIKVGQKHIQGLDPLDTAPLDHPPFAGRNTARNRVERDQALGTLLIAIEREGNPGTMKQ